MSLNGKHTFNSVPDIPQLCELKIATEIRINYDIIISLSHDTNTMAMRCASSIKTIWIFFTKNSRAVLFYEWKTFFTRWFYAMSSVLMEVIK